MRVLIRFNAGAALVMLGLMVPCPRDGSQPRAAETPASPTFFDWNGPSGLVGSKDISANTVKVTRRTHWRLTGTTQFLDYMTGGQSGIVDAKALASAEQARPPSRQVARHQEGKVLVRYWDDGQDAGEAAEYARRVAQSIHLVTTRIWPAKPTSIYVDIYVMPQGTTYSLARKVEWKSGRPLELAILIPGAAHAENHRIVAAHELYHALAALLRIGQWATGATEQAKLLAGLEEVAATSFASCGLLLADGYLLRPKASTFFIGGVRMQEPLSGDNVRQLLAWLRDTDARLLRGIGPTLGNVLDTTPVFHLFESAGDRIELHSPQGEQLLGMCRKFLPDPARVEPWLENISQERPDAGG
jgi:hypothetical protein